MVMLGQGCASVLDLHTHTHAGNRHTSHWDEQHRSLRTRAINKKKKRRARRRHREIETRFRCWRGCSIPWKCIIIQQSLWCSLFVLTSFSMNTQTQMITDSIVLFTGMQCNWLDYYNIKWIIKPFAAVVREY